LQIRNDLNILAIRIRTRTSLEKGVGSGVGAGSISQRYESGDLDPHQNVTDPQHCLPPIHRWNSFRLTNILVQTYAQKLKSVSIWNRQCATMLAAPIMGYDVILTLFGVNSDNKIFQIMVLQTNTI
jgi:hypothetical protein